MNACDSIEISTNLIYIHCSIYDIVVKSNKIPRTALLEMEVNHVVIICKWMFKRRLESLSILIVFFFFLNSRVILYGRKKITSCARRIKTYKIYTKYMYNNCTALGCRPRARVRCLACECTEREKQTRQVSDSLK